MVARVDADDYSDLTDGIIEVQLDGEAPPAPTGLKVKGGNEALSVSWDSIERSAVDDMQGYVLFCSRDDRPVFTNDKGEAAFNPPYETAKTLCPTGPLPLPPPPQALLVAAQTAETGTPLGPDGTPVPAPMPFVDRQKAYACTDLLTTQTGARLFRLQNHITYLVGIASVDDRGNISEIGEVTAQQPIPTVDFYRDYRADGGSAEGGFCAVAPSGGAGGWLVAAVLAAGLALLVRRRRR
jgi:MYXO-CTERM domain-containing protein